MPSVTPVAAAAGLSVVAAGAGGAEATVVNA
jgi:hypothetical protein